MLQLTAPWAATQGLAGLGTQVRDAASDLPTVVHRHCCGCYCAPSLGALLHVVVNNFEQTASRRML